MPRTVSYATPTGGLASGSRRGVSSADLAGANDATIDLGTEETVKRNHTWPSGAIALAIAAGLVGCKNDDAAIKALEELTTQLAQQVDDQNEEIAALTAEVEACMKDVANTKGEAVVMAESTTTVSVPSLEGESTQESLEALKTALKEASEAQKAALSALEAKKAQCAEDLEAARAKAEAAKEAKKEAARKKRKAEEAKPAAAKEREAEGRPTTGTGSRYQKR